MQAKTGYFLINVRLAFSSNITLRRHVDSIHKCITYTCAKCEIKKKNYPSLLRDVKSHKEQKEITCQECKKAFTRKEH